jgi:hypothetical protein
MTQRRALLIGIDRYERLPYPLAGCVNDVHVIGNLLQSSFGFPAEHIVWLVNEEATRAAILAALDALIEVTGPDDIVVIAYSGHGSQMTDRDGDEPDGMDETIVPHDSGREPDENRDITDDEIHDRMLAFAARTHNVTLLFDCCHSGSVSRDSFGQRIRWVPPDARPAVELPPIPPTPWATETSRDASRGHLRSAGQRYVLIAGCRDEESSFEHTVTQDGNVVTHGALTYFLAQQLALAAPGTTYRDVFEAASIAVTAAYPRQHPQMEGAADRELFGDRDFVPTRFVAVDGRSGSELTIRAGAAHGVSLGSRWAIYPAGTREMGSSTALASMSVVAVGATQSRGEIFGGRSADAIAAGCRAVEVSHEFGDLRLRVQVVAGSEIGAQAAMNEAIDASMLLSLVGERESADARVYLLEPRREAETGDPVPRVGSVSEPTWAIVGMDGELMTPTHALSDQDAVSTITADLEAAARYRHALLLRNPNPGMLAGAIDLVIKRLREGGWAEATLDPARGLVVFTHGDPVAVEIRNRSVASVYVSVLDFGVAGAIGALYPVSDASEPLAPGRSISVGERPGEEIELRFPSSEGSEYSQGWDGGEGVESFKLIATTRPADFSSLLQSGYRGTSGVGEPVSSVESLLSRALTGNATRDVARPVASDTDDAWVSVERSFLLRTRVETS